MGENIYRLLAPHRAVLSIYNSQVRRVICGNNLLRRSLLFNHDINDLTDFIDGELID